MQALLAYEGKPAAQCEIGRYHEPRPVRFVWHHIQPHEAGGPTTAENLIQVCDSCHYTIHRLLWAFRCQSLLGSAGLSPEQVALLASPPRRRQLTVAWKGFHGCQEAGTVANIPNEG